MGQTLIMLVDDEVYVTTVLSQQFQRRGYEVIVAADGQEALALAHQRRAHLIISDYQMPLLSGLEMAKKMLQDESTCAVPIIMLTARGHRLPPSEMLQTNIRCLLPKPFSIKELLAKVEEVLAHKAGVPGPSQPREVA